MNPPSETTVLRVELSVKFQEAPSVKFKEVPVLSVAPSSTIEPVKDEVEPFKVSLMTLLVLPEVMPL